jgi:hypothetical protein
MKNRKSVIAGTGLLRCGICSSKSKTASTGWMLAPLRQRVLTRAAGIGYGS